MATIFPYGPNIRRAPYVMSREYRTEIITSRAGKEQRRALRQTPRKRIQYLTGVQSSCLRAFDRLMVTAQRTQLAIPDRVRFVRLASGLAGGNDSVVLDVVPSWISVGAELMLVNGSDHDTRTVSDITGTTVTFDEFDSVTWPAGTRLHPSLRGYLDASIDAPIISQRGVVDVSVAFDVDPGLEPVEDDGAAAVTLAGREVFLKRPNRWLPISLKRNQDGVGNVDYGFGRVQKFFPIAFSTRLWEAGYTGCDFDHADEIRQFFDRMQGRRGEFYMPTWQQDLVPVSALTSAGTTITVSGTETDSVYSGSTVFKAIGVRKTDGTWITRTVSDIGTSGLNSVITVGSAWGQNVAVADIDRVSWLPVWRFATDILSMSWPREDVAEINLSFQMLEDLTVEI